MAFLKRLSDSLWDYVSPRKVDRMPFPTPETGKSARPSRKTPIQDVARHSKSMSPNERVSEWHIDSIFHPISPGSTKRKRLHTPGSGAGRRFKQPRIEVEDVEDTPSNKEKRLDSPMHDDYDDVGSCMRTPSRRLGTRSPSPSFEESLIDDDSMSSNLRVDDEQFSNTPLKQRMVHIPAELNDKHIGTEELRAKGWDDDYITLMQKIGLRGREPVLPAYMKFEYRFLPDGLFDSGDDAFISSQRSGHFKASKALQKLLDLGGHLRDRKLMEPEEARAELEVKKHLKEYIKWAENDADLSQNTAIPIMVQVYAEAGTPGDEIRAIAEAKCRVLVQRWKSALEVSHSVEFSPSSRASEGTLLSYELPTFYALLASDAIVAIMAYRVDTDECQPMALFDYNDKDYDVWNSLALAILICHVRNVQLRIAEDTDIGLKHPHYGESDNGLDEDA